MNIDDLMALADSFALDREAVGTMRARGQHGGTAPLAAGGCRLLLRSAIEAYGIGDE